MFVLLQPLLKQKGRLAEGLGTGLQNLLLRFKSGSDLNKQETPERSLLLFLEIEFNYFAAIPPY